MADEADIAQAYSEQLLAESLAAFTFRQQNTTSATHCIECDEPINESRRRALPGVELCLACKVDAEKTKGVTTCKLEC